MLPCAERARPVYFEPRRRAGVEDVAFTVSPQLPEFVKADSELSKNLVEEGRPDLASAMNWERNRPPILMNPALMASRLPAPFKTKPNGGATKLHGAGARH